MKNGKLKSKEEIRKELLSKRNSLSKSEVINKSGKILRRITAAKEFKHAKNIMFYVSKGNEVSSYAIIEYALKHKKTICVPKVDIKHHILHPIKINNLDKDLNKGHFGVHEPAFAKKRLVRLQDIDIIIVPGIAFDESGHRLGWGKGYYDKFLEKRRNITKIGLAFEFQVLPELPKDKHDIPVDMVITEKRIIRSQVTSIVFCNL